MENLPPEAPCLVIGDAGVIDGFIGSVNVTEVGRVGECRAGKESFLARGETENSGEPGFPVVIFKAKVRVSRDVSLRFIADGRV